MPWVSIQRCILSKFYIKPQQEKQQGNHRPRCILSKFYIKPQHQSFAWRRFCVVSYRNSTSNHNSRAAGTISAGLYLIEILHQTTTDRVEVRFMESCILSKFYIKPQQRPDCLVSFEVVSYRNSTSNHNSCLCISEETAVVSYRNSTSNHNSAACVVICFQLYLIEILHQTTTTSRGYWPQWQVVSYRNSTSNHNLIQYICRGFGVVSYRNSTSNHNAPEHTRTLTHVVSYRNSTSNHNHKPGILAPVAGCILSKFYIKPQPDPVHM